MRILDKYIIKEVLGVFIFGICAFSSVFIGTNTLFRIAQYVTTYGAGASSVMKMFLYSLPGIVVLTFPMSMLLASLLAFGRLSATSEITAMKSCGVSFYRLAAPVFAMALFVSVFAVFFSELVVPRANEGYRQVVEYEIKGNVAPKSQEHIVIKDVENGVIQRLTYARRYDEGKKEMEGVSIQVFDNGNLQQVQDAEYAVYMGDRWVMHNGVVFDLSAAGNVRRTMKFDRQILPINKTPKQISEEQKKPEEMTIKELRQQIGIMKREYVDTSKLEVELHQRLAISLASLVFAMVGAPLGMQPQRSSSSIGFGISIIVIFIYYAIMTVSSALGQGGALPPALAAWLPNLVGLAAGVLLVARAAR